MTDNEIDTRLNEHGAAWRGANQERPGVDWDVVTAPRRSRTWFAIAGVTAAAAAVVIPLALTTGGHTTSGPRPGVHPSPTSRTQAELGAPKYMSLLHNGTVVMIGNDGSRASTGQPGHPAVAVGASEDGSTAYIASAASGCRTSIDRLQQTPSVPAAPSSTGFTPPQGGSEVSPAVTIAGRPAPTAMAVSPDGTKLALVQDGVRNRHNGQCVRSDRLVVMNLSTHAVRVWSGPASHVVKDITWSPDSRHLAYLTSPTCRASIESNYSTIDCFATSVGTRVLDTQAVGSSVEGPPSVLGLRGANEKHEEYGPPLWWHGHLAVLIKSGIRPVDGHGGLGKPLAGFFPDPVESVSRDATGDHLLFSSLGITYSWDKGSVAVVPGQWTQASW